MDDDTSGTRTPFERCRAVRRDGQPCQGKAIADGLCFAHSAATMESRQRGGRATRSSERAAKLLPARLRGLVAELEEAFSEVHRGDLDARQGTAMASIALAIGRLITVGETEERLRECEAQLKQAARNQQIVRNGTWPEGW